MFALGKHQRGACTAQQASLPVSQLDLKSDIVTVVVVKSTATVIKGTWGEMSVEMMLDSGLLLSLVYYDVLQRAQNVAEIKTARLPIQLVIASGD